MFSVLTKRCLSLVLAGCLLCSTSCQDSQGAKERQLRYPREEAHFTAYLREHWNRDLSTDSAYYVLINEHACAGCVGRALFHFMDLPNAVIVADPAAWQHFCTDHVSHSIKANVLLDSSGKINRLRYTGANIGVIKVSHQHIDSMLFLDASNTAAILEGPL